MKSLSQQLTPGSVFEKYTIERQLGRGGMGAVYLVRHNILDSLFALKVLSLNSDSGNNSFVSRFIREAKLACKIKHPNLIEVHDAGKNPENGMFYIVMDYVPGGSVRDRLKKQPFLPLAESLRIVTEIASALEAAFQHGMVHRDIKPDNIMFAADGSAKLADLGIAKSLEEQDTMLTMAASVFGTPAYMSPEQAKDSGKVDCRADIYSLGIVFYEMLSGRRPYEGKSTIQILSQVVSETPVPNVRQIIPSIPENIAQLIADMTEKNLDRRIQTPFELSKRLTEIHLPVFQNSNVEKTVEINTGAIPRQTAAQRETDITLPTAPLRHIEKTLPETQENIAAVAPTVKQTKIEVTLPTAAQEYIEKTLLTDSPNIIEQSLPVVKHTTIEATPSMENSKQIEVTLPTAAEHIEKTLLTDSPNIIEQSLPVVKHTTIEATPSMENSKQIEVTLPTEAEHIEKTLLTDSPNIIEQSLPLVKHTTIEATPSMGNSKQIEVTLPTAALEHTQGARNSDSPDIIENSATLRRTGIEVTLPAATPENAETTTRSADSPQSTESPAMSEQKKIEVTLPTEFPEYTDTTSSEKNIAISSATVPADADATPLHSENPISTLPKQEYESPQAEKEQEILETGAGIFSNERHAEKTLNPNVRKKLVSAVTGGICCILLLGSSLIFLHSKAPAQKNKEETYIAGVPEKQGTTPQFIQKQPEQALISEEESPERSDPLKRGGIILLSASAAEIQNERAALEKKYPSIATSFQHVEGISSLKKQLTQITAVRPSLILVCIAHKFAEDGISVSGFENTIRMLADILHENGIPFLFLLSNGEKERETTFNMSLVELAKQRSIPVSEPSGKALIECIVQNGLLENL